MSDETAPAMDYDAHEQTYEGFINFSKIGTIAVLTIVVCLIMFAFGGTAATVFGWLLLIATLIATAVGMALVTVVIAIVAMQGQTSRSIAA